MASARSGSVLATPMRPVPGIYPSTPAPKTPYPPPASFHTSGSPFGARQALVAPSASSGVAATSPTLAVTAAPNGGALPASSSRSAEALKPAERAARTINEAFAHDCDFFPELDTYYSQGSSSGYEIAASPAWAPFQKVRMYTIPDQIFEQYNRAQVTTIMGLFAPLRYAWVSIDNALYMWDYTQTKPELLGYEGLTSCITAVTLGKPKPGVFLATVTSIIIIATTSEVTILGLGVDESTKQMSLFQTGLSTSIRGISATCIAHSEKTGRIFFGGTTDNEVHELTYQQQDGWFSPKCGKLTRTGTLRKSLAMALTFTAAEEYVQQMIVDDSRDLLYTLSSKSAIRIFHIQGTDFSHALTRSATDIYNGAAHLVPPNEVLNSRISIVSIAAIPRSEASRFALCATTATGYRIYLSTSGSSSYWPNSQSGPPVDMRAGHIRLPPEAKSSLPLTSPGSLPSHGVVPSTHAPIRTLSGARLAARYPPGYFFCFHNKNANSAVDQLFVAAPDTPRLYHNSEMRQPNLTTEVGTWLDLNSRAEDIGITVPFRPPVQTPRGFGNELATEFDGDAPEIAILTNTGIHILKRRRLVDVFAALIKQGGSNTEGFQTEINNLMRSYGRNETLVTALSVACGQGAENGQDSRSVRVQDPEVLEVARKTFIDFGGKPSINQNAITDKNMPLVDLVRPSPRHSAIALYLSRLLRATWRTPIVREKRDEKQGWHLLPNVALEKLRAVQEDLSQLQRFFNQNKSFIRGLGGPDDLPQTGTREDEVALQGEHRALHSLVGFVSSTIEGLSFVLVLFEESLTEVVSLLPEGARAAFVKLTFEELFSTQKGLDLAKELVKAIVNRNIARGSNVETVADAIRRRCGSFCSADDVVIFKAQEQLKRAAEAGPNAELARNLLNESLKLFEEVAHSLPNDYLRSAVAQFTELSFFAGAIQLALRVAYERDKANDALSWLVDGKPEPDKRKEKYDERRRCYDLIHDIVLAVDKSIEAEPTFVEGRPTMAAVRRNEAYEVIARSNDEAFLTNLYDWYLSQGWQDRILATESSFIVKYLHRKSADDIQYADLLWRYYGQTNQFQDAAQVQLQLAQSAFDLGLDRRIEYLSRARANASTYTQGTNRKNKQILLQQISELLDIANIQDEVLQRLRDDPRLPADRRDEVLRQVDGPVLDISTLFNNYANAAGYYDVCLLIYQAADHRDPSSIKQTWQQLLQEIHDETVANGTAQPFEAIAQQVIDLGSKLRLSEFTFPVPMLLPTLMAYSHQNQRNVAPAHWVTDIFLSLEVSYEQLFDVLELMFYNNDPPFVGTVRKVLVQEVLYVVEKWWSDSTRAGGVPFGSDTGVARVEEVLEAFVRNAKDVGADAELLQRSKFIIDQIRAEEY
ncbi:hypothetical protein DV738_g115, partial [Chaetothyriales sp. CBS 135597]